MMTSGTHVKQTGKWRIGVALGIACVAAPAAAQEAVIAEAAGKRSFAPEFFAAYAPVSALDMVQRIPGFSIEGTDGRRGFGENAGNVLIDGDRPSTKSDDIFAVLSRIPANQVERIELSEQAGADGEARGKGQVVNVIRKASSEVSGTYDVNLRMLEGRGPSLFGGTSATLRRGKTTYEVNLSSFSQRERANGPEDFFNGSRKLQERRSYVNFGTYSEASLGGSIKTRIGQTKVNTNAKLTWQDSIDTRTGAITASGGGNLGNELLFSLGPQDDIGFELGGDVELPISGKLTSKAIALYRQDARESLSQFDDNRIGQPLSSSVANGKSKSTEAIFRVQNDWSAIKNHAIQFGAEFAYNRLRSDFASSNRIGDIVTPFQPSDVVVRESRIEPFVSDVWTVSPDWKIEAGLILEASRLTLSGDSTAKRSFKFVKPRMAATWTVDKATSFEFRAERQVAQLDFDEFATSVDFGQGGQVDAGNADLVPEKTTSLSALVRHKFMGRGSIQLLGSYVLVSDTQDLVPVTTRDAAGNIVSRFDGSGNIGNSRRWNGELEITLPFDWITKPIGISGMELKYVGHYHGSQVTDPVTGLKRRRSNEALWHQNFEFQHDISKAGIAWGVSAYVAADRPAFFLNQYRTENNGTELNAYVEYKKLKIGTIRFWVGNVLNAPFERKRQFFRDTRATGDLTRIIERKRFARRRFQISINGKF
jgi:outer membrane receptor protein involved in Fe transport